MAQLLLVPLDDTVVFPTMDVTLTVDVGDDERVLLVPRHESEFAKVGTIAEVTEHVRLPGGGRAVALSGVAPRRRRRRPHRPRRPPARRGRRAPRRRARSTAAPASSSASTAPSSRRSSSCAATTAASARSCARSPSPARWPTRPATRPTSTFEQKVELLETLDVTERLELAVKLQRERLAELQVRKRIREDVAVRRREAAARVLPAQADGVDPQGARRGRRLGRRGVPHEDRRRRHARGGRGAGPQGARPPRAHGRAVGRGVDDPDLPRLADRRAVERSAPRSSLDPVHAREVLDADHAGLEDVKDRITEYLAVRKLRTGARHRGRQALRRDPDPDRPARHRQDLDRRVDRPRDRTRVRAHVARRRARRGRDPRPPAHLHRRAAGPPGARAARRRHDEPGDHARRGRQGRRRLARRPERGAARGARPGAEPLVPRPLPRRRARPLARSCSSRPPTSPTRSPARCWTAWR